jgi:mannose-6-phosphate isomerase-like protein (cupin superfamily)
MPRPLILPVAAALLAGFAAGRLMPAAAAGEAALLPAIVHVGQLTDADLGPARPGMTLHTRTVVATPGATVSVQTGDVFKHSHANTDEIQYIVEGSGTFWLGDEERSVGPGDLIVIPRGTAHAGSHATSGRFKAIAIKTPPQAADDTRRLD